MRCPAPSTSRPASTTNTMASSGISSLRDRLHRAAGVAQGEGVTGPPLLLAITKWAATVVLIVLLAPLRSLNLCLVAIVGLAPFLPWSRIGQFVARQNSPGRDRG